MRFPSGFEVESGFFEPSWADIDPIALGTGTLEPNGLTPRELFPLLRRLGAEANLVGVEMVELNPLVDPRCVTLLVANRCAWEILTGVATRMKGITEAHYLALETIDHGQSRVWRHLEPPDATQ